MIAWQIIHGIFTAFFIAAVIALSLEVARMESELARLQEAQEVQVKFNDEAVRLLRDIVRTVKQR